MITLINGFPQGPNGLIVPLGSIKFALNVDGTVIAGPGGFVAADIPVVFQFNAAGQIQPNPPAIAAKIWSNEELQPQLSSSLLGTYYLVTFYDQNGAVLNATPLWWQFPESNGATVDISQMTPISTVGGNIIYYPTSFLGTPAGSDTDVQVNSGGVFYGDGNFTYDHVTIQATIAALSNVNLSSDIFSTIIPQTASLTITGILNGSSGPAYPIKVMGQVTNNTVTSGVYVTTLAQGTVDSFMAAVEANNYTKPDVSATFNLAASVIAYTQNNGPGTVTELTGMYSQTGNFGGITTRASCFVALTNNVNSGTLHNNFGFHSQTMAGFGDTLNAAFHADDQTSGYAFYAVGGLNYFGGIATATTEITNPTAASGGGNHSSPIFAIRGTYWTGSASAVDSYTFQDVIGSGSNPATTLTITHTGSGSGALTFSGTVNLGPIASTASITASTDIIALQTSPATGIANFNSGHFELIGTYWTGSASAADIWTIQNVLGSGTNPTSTLTFVHTGSSGSRDIDFGGTPFSGVGTINATGISVASGGVNILNAGLLSFQSANAAQQIVGQSSELITLNTGGTTTDSSTNLLPAGAIIDAVVARVVTTISGGSTPTTWEAGDATTAARFISTGNALTAGTTAVGLNQMAGGISTDAAGPTQAAAAKVRITLDQIPGQGSVRVTVFYRSFSAPTS